eukprot:Rmarinus@m.12872
MLGSVLALLGLGACAAQTTLTTDAVNRLDTVEDVRMNFLGSANVARRSGEPTAALIQVAFSALEERFEYHLQYVPDLMAEGAVATFYDSDNNVVGSTELVSSSYRYYGSDAQVSMTLHEDDRFHMTVVKGNEMYTIEPVERHVQDASPEAARRLLSSESGMVAFKQSDLSDEQLAATCGVQSESGEMHTESRRNLLMSNERSLLVERWNDCFYDGAIEREMTVGMAGDAGFYRYTGSSQSASVTLMEEYLADSNIIYYNQVGIFLRMGQVELYTSDGGVNWNTPCPDSINTQLDNFRDWSKPSGDEGLWHLMTNCWPPPGTVGLAWVGTLCSKSYGTGVSSVTGDTWTVVAHEIGHNYGAGHSFEEGQGSTGGIMDYGDGKLDGEYQFNSKYRKTEVCAEINSALQSSSNCFRSYNPVCGNGVMEDGEECDDTSSCCNSDCTLASGAQCSGDGECCTNCLFEPSSTNCGVDNMKYCNNGLCTSSEICYWTDAYCGTKADNACQVECRSSGTCYDAALFGLDNRVPDGTACSQSPYGTCNNGVCETTGETLPNYWVAGQWSSCSVSCGMGTQTRDNLCYNPNTDTYVADSECNAADQPSTSQSCDAGVCTTYSWSSSYGTCFSGTDGLICGSGTRTVTSTCYSSTGQIVADSYCTDPKPASSEACSLTSCDNFYWYFVQYTGGCTATDPSQPCGSSAPATRPADYRCLYPDNDSIEDDINCLQTAAKPTSDACTLPDCPTYYWSSVTSDECVGADGATCGYGTRAIENTCVDSSGNAVSDSLCTDPEPATSETCYLGDCGTYEWELTYGECSASCGPGSRTVFATCIDTATGDPVSDSLCDGPDSPPSAESCNLGDCVSYSWVVSYGACEPVTADQECGTGSQQVYAQCIDDYSGEGAEDSSLCEGTFADVRECDLGECVARWVTGPWHDCSVSCGTGSQYRSVICEYQTATSRCDTASMPVTQRECHGSSMTCTYQWVANGGYSECEGVCGEGVSYALYDCVDPATGLAFDDDLCSGEAPVYSEVCMLEPCAELADYIWQASGFTSCDVSGDQVCGYGTQYRTYDCVNSETYAVESNTTLCGPEPTPAPETCYTGTPCPSYGYWEGDWSACSATCGGGTQTRDVTCMELNSATTTDAANCASIQTPATERQCNLHQCPQYQYFIGDWEDCSAQCGGGEETRHIECMNRFTWETVAFELCETEAPESVRECNTQACSSYNWQASSWTQCDQKCGGGTRHRTVTCHTAAGALVEDDRCDVNYQPSSQSECNVFTCPLFSWQVEETGTCSKECGAGTVDRTVWCQDVDGLIVENRMCNSALHSGHKPLDAAVCNPTPCENNGICECSSFSSWSDCVCDLQLSYRTRVCEDIGGSQDCDTLGYKSVEYEVCDCDREQVPDGYTYSVKIFMPYETVQQWSSWLHDQQERIRWVLSRAELGLADYSVTIYQVNPHKGGTVISFYAEALEVDFESVSWASNIYAMYWLYDYVAGAAAEALTQDGTPDTLGDLPDSGTVYLSADAMAEAFSMLDVELQMAAFNGFAMDESYNEGSGGDDDMTDILIGVGTGTGVGVCAAMAFFLNRRKKDQNRLMTGANSSDPGHLPFKNIEVGNPY